MGMCRRLARRRTRRGGPDRRLRRGLDHAGPHLAPLDGAHLHRVLDALERRRARFGYRELDRARRVQRRLRHEDLLARRGGADASRYVDALATIVAALVDRLGGVDPDPDPRREAVLSTMPHEQALDVDGTVDGLVRPVECGEEAVARVGDDDAPVLADRVTQLAIVPAE